MSGKAKKVIVSGVILTAALFLAVVAASYIASRAQLEAGTSEADSRGISGADWRTHRGYGYGEISGTTGVFYFFYDDGTLAFYEDSPSGPNEIFRIDLGEAVDPEYAASNLSFEDINGDGFNDLCVPMSADEEKCWFWLPEEHVFADEPVTRGIRVKK